MGQTDQVSDDDTPALPDDERRVGESARQPAHRSTIESRFPVEAATLGVAIVALLVAAIVTLLSINDGGGADQLSIGSEPDRARPTFDASISDDGDGDGDGGEPSAAAGRDISITDEPIVIDADGNVVDPAGGNGGAALPSESVNAENGQGSQSAPDDVDDGDDGTNLFGGDDPEDKLMPDLICRGLQAAQDEIQDRGVFGSKSKDATGRGRRQLWDRNWVVVAQDPEPGEKIGEFEAILYVVKQRDDENICD